MKDSKELEYLWELFYLKKLVKELLLSTEIICCEEYIQDEDSHNEKCPRHLLEKLVGLKG